MKVTIARFGIYPKEEPSGYVVGFAVTTTNNRSFYRDVIIPFEEVVQKTDDEIAEVAYAVLQEEIETEVERLEELSPLLGMTIRSSEPEAEEPEEFEDPFVDSEEPTDGGE